MLLRVHIIHPIATAHAYLPVAAYRWASRDAFAGAQNLRRIYIEGCMILLHQRVNMSVELHFGKGNGGFAGKETRALHECNQGTKDTHGHTETNSVAQSIAYTVSFGTALGLMLAGSLRKTDERSQR